MLAFVQVVSVLLVAIAMAMALAHALEYPGKLRLSKEAYIATQPIYYPGFTIGGAVGEFGGILVTLGLLALTPMGRDFWLVLGAVAGLIAMQGVYWTMTHPVNRFWLKDTKLGSAGAGFFGSDPLRTKNDDRPAEWTDLRDQWEYSHVIRAALGLASLALLTGSLVA
jgi:hypothetical protein